MIRLDSTVRKLQAVLAGAVTTNQLPIVVCYSDKTATTYTGGTTVINTNSGTAVDICAAPAASTIRDIDSITVQNADTVAATLTLRYNDNGTTYTLFKGTLSVGDQVIYTHGQGWKVLDSSGATKNLSSDVVTLTGTQTLTNKTFTSPVINSPDINTPDIDGGSIDSTAIGSTTPSTVQGTNITATQKFYAASGLSAAAPDYSFSADNTLGIFRLVNTLGVAVAGVERGRWDNAYNYGIGASSTVTPTTTGLSVSVTQNIYTKEADGNSYANFFRQNSSANAVLAFGLKYSNTASAYASSQPANVAKAAIAVTNGGFYVDAADAAVVAAGTDVTTTRILRLLKGQTLTLEGATASSGTGVAFPATQSASTDANTLDDYEEGTFTPTVEGTTVAGAGTYSTQTGRYTKIGNRVLFNLELTWTAHTGTGNLRLASLPFTIGAAGNIALSIVCNNLTLAANSVPAALAIAGGTTANLYSLTEAVGTISFVAMDTAATIYVSGQYSV